jgi:hypothetical protein
MGFRSSAKFNRAPACQVSFFLSFFFFFFFGSQIPLGDSVGLVSISAL